jgi:NAD(P)H-dependent FMN reductase
MNLVDLLKIGQGIEGSNSVDSREAALVNALKPFIEEEKHEQLDKIVLVASLLAKEKSV